MVARLGSTLARAGPISRGKWPFSVEACYRPWVVELWRVKIEAILWANAAVVDANALLNVEGASWRYVERDFFPATLSGNVCGVVLVEDEDFGSLVTVSLEVFDDSGQVDGSAGSMIFDCREVSAEMSVSRLPFAFPFMTVIREPTLLKARVVSNGGELAGLAVIVRRTPSSDG